MQNEIASKLLTEWQNFWKFQYSKHYWWLAELICKKVSDDVASFHCWDFNTVKVFVC